MGLWGPASLQRCIYAEEPIDFVALGSAVCPLAQAGFGTDVVTVALAHL